MLCMFHLEKSGVWNDGSLRLENIGDRAIYTSLKLMATTKLQD